VFPAGVLLAVLTAIAIVLAMKIVGVVLTSALLIVSAVRAFQVTRSFRGTVFFAALSVWIGIVISFLLNLPTGATIVLPSFAFSVVFYIVKTMPAFVLPQR
jgi:zinc transport system permease protein